MEWSFKRAQILRTIKDNEPINITSLCEKVNISKGNTIYRYLKELEFRGLISTKKEKGTRGEPTLLMTTKKAKALPKWIFEFGKSK